MKLDFSITVFGFVNTTSRSLNRPHGGASCICDAAPLRQSARWLLLYPLSQSSAMLLSAVRTTRAYRTSGHELAEPCPCVASRTTRGASTGGPIDLPSSLAATTKATRILRLKRGVGQRVPRPRAHVRKKLMSCQMLCPLRHRAKDSLSAALTMREGARRASQTEVARRHGAGLRMRRRGALCCAHERCELRRPASCEL